MAKRNVLNCWQLVFFFVLCTLCCQFLWIVPSVFSDIYVKPDTHDVRDSTILAKSSSQNAYNSLTLSLTNFHHLFFLCVTLCMLFNSELYMLQKGNHYFIIIYFYMVHHA